MTDPKQLADLLSRTIVLVYGILENGGPCWIYAAVKPSKYEDFQKAHKDGTLDLHHFEPYGEIIVSGEGKSPPDEVTLKVAEMYQTDQTKMLQDIDKKEKKSKKDDKKT
jgi:hypothetical protein